MTTAASLEQTRQLLEAAQVIASHQAQIARLRGLNFNVFRLLGVERDEVRLHSRFIAELLDPRGSHGEGSAFLEMFRCQVECALPGDTGRIDADRARVEAPHYIGRIHWQDTDSTGGSIDILITDGVRHISIENKIDHDEGDHQVDRYCNYNPKNFVLFLTLDGRKAHTAKKNEKRYTPISYGEHIAPWLERCHQHCTDLPVLRESIKQYLVVVNELTGGDPLMQEINEDVKRLLRQNMEAARLVHGHFMPTIHEAVREFVESLEREMKCRLEPAWEIENTIGNEEDPNDNGVQVWSKAWPHEGNRWWVKWQYKKGGFEYGLFNPEPKDRKEIGSLLDESVVGLRFYERDQLWAFWKRMDISPNLEDDMTALERLLDKQERSRLAKQVADELLEFVHACDSAFKAST